MKQWVCKACGYNMIGERPDVCPFCGASHDQFLGWEEAEKIYRVSNHCVNDKVSQLLSEPRLGLEHAAYRIETEQGPIWIDCPSVYNRDLESAQAILFTHPHFMGASNQYRQLWRADVYIHALDAVNPLVKAFPIDVAFNRDFVFKGVSAYHIGGHTPGFTIYVYQQVLFVCDYAFPSGHSMRLNPHGPKHETRKGAERLLNIIEQMPLQTVCGYNYVCDYSDWLVDYRRIINKVD